MPKFKLVTKAALVRVSILLAVLGILVFCAWFMMMRMPLKSYAGPRVPLNPEETAWRDALKRNVEMLAGTIGERNVFRPKEYHAAADFVDHSLAQAGYRVNRQAFEVMQERCENLEAVVPGHQRAQEIVVVGAHYDSVSGCPGANDNGSAVAALLVLAQAFAHSQPERTLRFVAFANEEPPFFQTEQMGSLVYARHCRASNDNIVAMISLETIGYYRDQKGSQKYPFPIGLFYPSTGNFIGLVGNTKSAKLVRQCVACFRRQVKFPCEGGALPAALPGIGWSDHWAFWQVGYPGLMVTDTAPFRYPYYHTVEDMPEKLDYERTARVVAGMKLVIEELVGITPALNQ